MSLDHYKTRLAHAQWTWREWVDRYTRPRTKDRRMGRNEKRSARQDERREVDRELA